MNIAETRNWEFSLILMCLQVRSSFEICVKSILCACEWVLKTSPAGLIDMNHCTYILVIIYLFDEGHLLNLLIAVIASAMLYRRLFLVF